MNVFEVVINLVSSNIEVITINNSVTIIDNFGKIKNDLHFGCDYVFLYKDDFINSADIAGQINKANLIMQNNSKEESIELAAKALMYAITENSGTTISSVISRVFNKCGKNSGTYLNSLLK